MVWCSGRLSNRQFTLNLAKVLAKRSSKNKRSYHGWLSTMTSQLSHHCHDQGRHFLLGPGAEDCAPTPLSQGRIKVVKSTGKMFIISNRSFILKTGTGQCSRLRSLKNGVPQSSTFVPVLFNIYITDISETVSSQYGYADDLALLFSHKCWHEVKEVLSLDM